MHKFEILYTSGEMTPELFTDDKGLKQLNRCSKRKLFGKNRRYEIDIWRLVDISQKEYKKVGTIWLFKKHIAAIMVG